jgi:glycosyltransferase involved in cell wall biosynthesis
LGADQRSIAIVTAWAGTNLRGGAEMLTWQLAKRLTERGRSVEIITTCCRSPDDDWSSNAYRPGLTVEDGVAVRRFRVDRRDRAGFARADQALITTPRTSLRIGVNPASSEDSNAFATEGIKSSALLSHLARSRSQYAQFVFMQYLYGTTLQGLPLVADRAFLQPTLHNEPYAYIPEVAAIFQQARGLLFISAGEFELAQRLYGPGIIPKSHVIGAGVEQNEPPGLLTDVRGFDPRSSRFVLYLGRQDSTKNVDLLIQSFEAYRSRRPLSDLKLILAGQHGHSIVKSGNGIVNLGVVSDAEKAVLLRHCRALAQPSTNESFSRVMVEAWSYGRPVIVHAECLATAVPVSEAGAGWIASDVHGWSRSLETIDGCDDAILEEKGARGRAYALEYGNWDKALGRYEHVLGLEGDAPDNRTARVVHQIVRPDDPGGNEYARALARALTRRGISSSLTADNPGADGLDLVHASSALPEIRPDRPQVLIFHSPSAGDEELTAPIERFAASGKRLLASTPEARSLLERAGHRAEIVPICADPREWDVLPDRSLIAALQDGRTNLVFAGDFVEFGHLGELIEAFLHFLTLERYARLVLVGSESIDPAVHAKLLAEVESLQLSDNVVVTTGLPVSQRLAVYRTSRLFWSMDERGDLGYPLLTAMWFDIPILTFKNPTATFLARDCSLLFTSKGNLLEVAALAKVLTTDEKLRESIVIRQRLQRERFSTDRIINAILDEVPFAT